MLQSLLSQKYNLALTEVEINCRPNLKSRQKHLVYNYRDTSIYIDNINV